VAVLIGDQDALLDDDPSAHGTGFDRAGAISAGWADGVPACVALPGDPPPMVQGQVSFSTGDDLPFDQLVPVGLDVLDAADPSAVLAADAVRLDGCPGAQSGTKHCGDGTVGVDAAELRDLYDEFGDMAAWVPLVRAHRDAAGAPGGPGGRHDCAVGALAADMLQGQYSPTTDDTVTLSAQDLDEIVLQLSRDSSGDEAFARLAELRRGFDQGWAACT